MPNDAKLGLFLGVVVVIAIAVVYFRKEGSTALPLAAEATAASVHTPKAPPPPSQRLTRPVKAHPTRQRDRATEVGSEAAPREQAGQPVPEATPSSPAPADEDSGP